MSSPFKEGVPKLLRRMIAVGFLACVATPIGLHSTASAQSITNCGAGEGVSFVPGGTCSIGNQVFIDANNSGALEAGEKGASGVTVHLWNGNADTGVSTFTDANGIYGFFDLIASTNYQVCIDLPGGYSSSNGSGDLTPGQVDASAPDANNLIDNDDNARISTPLARLCSGYIGLTGDTNSNGRVDFGIFQAGYSVGNQAFIDANNSGVYETGENGLGGATLRLWNNNAYTGTSTVTDANGIYGFHGLAASTSYQVCLDAPSGYRGSNGSGDLTPGQDDTTAADPNNFLDNDDNGRVSTPADGVCSGYITLNGTTASNGRVDFGVYTPGYSVGNHVFVDANNSGVYDTGERSLGGVDVHLWNSNGDTGRATKTGATGIYGFFDLAASTSYQVCIDMPAGYVGSTGSGSVVPGQADTSAPDPNNYLDNDDNGRISTPAGKVCSGYIILSGATSSNGRVDFGLFQPVSVPTLPTTSTPSTTRAAPTTTATPTTTVAPVALVPLVPAAATTTTATVAPTTTAAATTTTTAAPTTTVKVNAQVEGVQVVADAAPAQAVGTVDPALTGAASSSMALIAALLMTAGLLLMLAASIRRTRVN